MPGDKKRIPRNMARIEFLASRDAIESLLSQGFDKRKIHTRLTESGQFTMSYDAFCKVLAKAASNNLNVQSLNVAPHVPAPAATPAARPITTGPKIITPAAKSFPDPRNMNPDDAL